MRPLRVYLAGASRDIAVCESYRDRLRAAGIEITHDWMADIRANAHRPDRVLPPHERADYAWSNLSGVAAADVFWLLAPAPSVESIGCWVELGAALTQRRDGLLVRGGPPEIIVSGPWRTIFQDLAGQLDETHEGGFECVLAWDRVRRGMVGT